MLFFLALVQKINNLLDQTQLFESDFKVDQLSVHANHNTFHLHSLINKIVVRVNIVNRLTTVLTGP